MPSQLVVAWDYGEAVTASRKAQEVQKLHEKAREDAGKELAEKERTYRKALADRIIGLVAEGTPATVARDLARGDKAVASLGYDRDVAKSVADVMEQGAWRHTANRKDVEKFIEWSMKVAPLGEQHERMP